MYGNFIKNKRKELRISQKKLAELANVTQQAVSRYENNTSEPSFTVMKRICQVFNISPEEIYTDDKECSVSAPASNDYKRKYDLLLPHQRNAVNMLIESFYEENKRNIQ